MKKLFLHIGSHKTGTTSIQLACIENKVFLRSQGYDYFSRNRKGKFIAGGNASKWIKCSNQRRDDISKIVDFFIDPKDVRNLKKQLLTSSYNNIVLSAEDFSFILDEKNIQLLKDSLSSDFDVKVICYIRRQDKLAISHFQQASKRKISPSRHFYNGGFAALPSELERCDSYLNFHEKLEKWINAFGQDNVIIKVFERDRLIGGDAVNDFMSLLGIDFEGLEAVKSNESNGFERTKIGHLINSSQVDKNVASLIKQHLDNESPMLPSKEEAQAFYNRYKQSNIELNKKYKISEKYEDIFGEDFSRYPDSSQDKWDEESANRAILNILNSLTFSNLLKVVLSNAKHAWKRKLERLMRRIKQRIQ